MIAGSPEAGSPSQRALRIGLVVAFVSLGLAALHWPMLSSGFERIQTDEGDTRINLYALEHDYRWLVGAQHHEALWSPPVYYPQQWTAACTEVLLGLAPIYALWRASGVPSDTAYQLWLVVLSSLNFFAALAWLIHGRRLPLAPAVLGGWLIAFAGSRAAQLGHAQLLAVFIPLLALLICDRLRCESSPRHRRLQIGALGALAVWQLYAGTYVLFFCALASLFIAAIVLADPAQRRSALAIVTAHPLTVVITAIASLMAAAPWLHAAWMASDFKGYPPPSEVLLMLPRLTSWLFPPDGSLLYGRLAEASWVRSLPLPDEHHLFLGIATTALGAYGCWLGRNDATVRTLASAGAAIFLVTTLPGGVESAGAGARGIAALLAVLGSVGLFRGWARLGGATRVLLAIACLWLGHCALTGRPTLWLALYDLVPPLRALRAIARFGLFIAIPLGLGACMAIAHIAQRRHGRALAICLAAVCMLEQLTATPSFSKVEHRARIARIAAAIPEAADVFYYSPIASERGLWLDQLDGMFAQLALEREVPTINGNLNVIPIPWQRLATPNINKPHSRVRLELGLEEWKAQHPRLNDLRVEWVTVPGEQRATAERPKRDARAR